MINQTREELIKELNEILKNVSICNDEELPMQAENIRLVFYTMMDNNFTQDEMIKVFDGVNINAERLALVDENDQYMKR